MSDASSSVSVSNSNDSAASNNSSPQDAVSPAQKSRRINIKNYRKMFMTQVTIDELKAAVGNIIDEIPSLTKYILKRIKNKESLIKHIPRDYYTNVLQAIYDSRMEQMKPVQNALAGVLPDDDESAESDDETIMVLDVAPASATVAVAAPVQKDENRETLGKLKKSVLMDAIRESADFDDSIKAITTKFELIDALLAKGLTAKAVQTVLFYSVSQISQKTASA